MKKLLLALIAVSAFVAFNADARYYRNSNCGSCVKSCAPKCEVIEEACPQPPCCVKYARVTFPAQKKTFIRHEWVCPTDCIEEGQQQNYTTNLVQ